MHVLFHLTELSYLVGGKNKALCFLSLMNPLTEIRCYDPETGEEVILDWDFGN